MVFGLTGKERIQLNEDTLWSGFPHDYTHPGAATHLGEVRKMIFDGKYGEAQKIVDQHMMGIPRFLQAYQTLGDLGQLRSFLVSATLLSFLDGPFAPLFMLAIFLIHPHLGFIVLGTALLLLIIAKINQRITSQPFGEANMHQSKANLHLDAMSRNSQIINALAMIPEAVRIWGRDTAASLRSQVIAQDRNIVGAAGTRGCFRRHLGG